MTADALRAFVVALALVLAAGCGDGSPTGDDGSLHVSRTPGILCYSIDGHQSPDCPTPTPCSSASCAYRPARATISCFTIRQTPAGPCRTPTPLPN
ncbi:MAG TPA: hypothetical protein VL049_00100 [Candidatus Dormibacteraeota bacterium]|nr:hypothetical protein [Candidatus Dormibacteraeota bacterium]